MQSLTLGTFALAGSELLPMGLLTPMARDIGVSEWPPADRQPDRAAGRHRSLLGTLLARSGLSSVNFPAFEDKRCRTGKRAISLELATVPGRSLNRFLMCP